MLFWNDITLLIKPVKQGIYLSTNEAAPHDTVLTWCGTVPCNFHSALLQMCVHEAIVSDPRLLFYAKLSNAHFDGQKTTRSGQTTHEPVRSVYLRSFVLSTSACQGDMVRLHSCSSVFQRWDFSFIKMMQFSHSHSSK